MTATKTTTTAPKKREFSSALIDRASLAAAVEAVSRVIARKNTIPVLGNVCLRGCDDGLRVTGTDMDIEINRVAAGSADPHFAITVPAHDLRDLLKKAKSSEMVAIDVHPEGETKFDFSGLKVSLQSRPEEDFPVVSHEWGDRAVTFSVEPKTLVDALNRTSFAISSEETRYYLNGIYMHVRKDELLFVATDGHRLARHVIACPEGAANMEGVIVPRQALAEIQKFAKAKGVNSPVEVTMGATRSKWVIGGTELVTKHVDGSFPDYSRVIPSGNDKRVTFDRKAMIEAVNAVTVISSEKGRACKFMFSADSARLVVANPDVGTASLDVVVGYDGAPIDIGFNARYVVEMLSAIDTEEASFTMADSGSPSIVQAVRGETQTDYVLMPMRV